MAEDFPQEILSMPQRIQESLQSFNIEEMEKQAIQSAIQKMWR